MDKLYVPKEVRYCARWHANLFNKRFIYCLDAINQIQETRLSTVTRSIDPEFEDWANREGIPTEWNLSSTKEVSFKAATEIYSLGPHNIRLNWITG